MTQVETGVAGGVSFALTAGAARAARARARVRREGDPAEGGRVRRALDASGRRHREGARARPDEPPHPESLGGPGLPAFDGDARRRGAELGLLGHRHLDPRERPRRRARSSSRASDEQKATWLPPLLEEPILCSFGLSEPDAGSDVARMKTTAERARRRVRPQRLEDLHHERRPRGVDGRLREDRPERRATAGSPAFVVPMDTPGVHDREAPRQDGAARDRHVRVRAHRTSSSRPRTGSARRATASRSRCRRSTSRARARRPAPSASPRPPTSSPSSTRRSASRFDVPIAMHQGVNFLIADMATEIEAARLLDLAGGVAARPGRARDARSRRSRSASPPTRR